MAVIGVSTCAYLEMALPAAIDRIAKLADAVEVRCIGSHRLETKERIRAVMASGLRCSVHAPDHLDIWSTDRRLRLAGIAGHQRLLEASATVQAEVYVVHPDYSAAPIAPCPWTREALEESFAVLHQLGRSYSVRVAVENMAGRWSSHVAAPGIDLCGLGLALDVGHAQISGSLEAYARSTEIVHMHLHDNLGESDQHLPVGRGRLTPGAVAGLLRGFDGICVLEHANEDDVRAGLAFLEAVTRSEALPAAGRAPALDQPHAALAAVAASQRAAMPSHPLQMHGPLATGDQ